MVLKTNDEVFPAYRLLGKWINDPQAVELLVRLQIFAVEDGTPVRESRTNDQRIPEGKRMEPKEINGAEYEIEIDLHHVQSGEDLDLAPRDLGSHLQLAGDRREVFL